MHTGQNTFTNHILNSPKLDNFNFYSKLEDLTEEQKCSFQASKFNFKLIPLVPPPKEYC